jgi:hypothetical protein
MTSGPLRRRGTRRKVSQALIAKPNLLKRCDLLGSFGFFTARKLADCPRSGRFRFFAAPRFDGWQTGSGQVGFGVRWGSFGLALQTPAAAIVATQLASATELASARAERPPRCS